MYSHKKAFMIALFASICAFICASIYSMNQEKKLSEIYKTQDKKRPQTLRTGTLKRSKATINVFSLIKESREEKQILEKELKTLKSNGKKK